MARWLGLQARMTLSYIAVTVAATMLLTGISIALMAIITQGILPQEGAVLVPLVQQHVQVLAVEAALQANGATLDPATTFVPNQPATLALPQGMTPLSDQDSPQQRFAGAVVLLIAPNGQVLASSAPQRYPPHAPIASLLPRYADVIAAALAGTPATYADLTPYAGTIVVVAPVLNRAHAPLGAIYVQETPERLHAAFAPLLNPWAVLGPAFTFGLILLLAPVVGGVFGFLTTRGIVRRVRSLAVATTHVGAGQYADQVKVRRQDELGQLETQFNDMAAQLAASIQQQQTLAAQNAQLAERARIGRELHDAIAQNLFSLRMLADGMQHALPEGEVPHHLQSHLTAMADTTTMTIREMRALLMELRPIDLEGLSLASALGNVAQSYQERMGIAITTTLTAVTLPAATEDALLRIAQEALSNAARHAHATSIDLSLAAGNHGVTLCVADDGDGFDEQEARTQHGLGLRIMRERVTALQGIFTLTTQPGQGTKIEIFIPEEGDDHDSARAHR